MRKILTILVCLLLISGCGKKEEEITINYDTTYYEVASPYQEAVGSYSLRSFDKNTVESMLMNVSMEYFKNNNSIYQNGQYLTTKEMKELLSKEKLNKADKITVDHVEIDPTFISAIYEQNYLATNGNLKGISLAIILDSYQSYQEDNKTLYKTVDENRMLEFGKQKALELLQYMRSKEELKNIKIVLGLYTENDKDLKGSLPYLGYSENDKIAWKQVSYHYELLDGNTVMNNDMKTYNTYLALKREFSSLSNVYINAIGLYRKNQLLNIQMTFQSNDFPQSKILDISKRVSTCIREFNSNIAIKIELKTNHATKAFFIKKENSTELETYLLEE